MAEAPLTQGLPDRRRSARIVALWVAAIPLLTAAVLLWQFVVLPIWQTHRVIEEHGCPPGEAPFPEGGAKAVVALGGTEAAARRLEAYVVFPRRLAPHKEVAAAMLTLCGPHGAEACCRMIRNGRPATCEAVLRGMFGAAKNHTACLEVCRDPEVVRCLAEAMGTRSGFEIRPLARDLLLTAGEATHAAGPVLVRNLGHPDAEVRYFALMAMRAPAPASAGSVLIGMLTDDGREVRQFAAMHLGAMKPAYPGALPALTRLLDDPEASVREAAREALHSIKGRSDPAVPAPGGQRQDRTDRPSGGGARDQPPDRLGWHPAH